jgi:hypothetical protein
MTKIALTIALFLALATEPSFGQGTKVEDFEIESQGKSKNEAVQNGLADVLLQVSESLIGDSAFGEIGDKFIADFHLNYERKKKRYFNSRLRTECENEGNEVYCLIEGAVKIAAVTQDLKKSNKSQLTSMGKDFVFAASRGNLPNNHLSEKLLSGIRGEFQTLGHKFEFREARDFYGISMNIISVKWSGMKHDKITQSMRGGLDIPFEIWFVHRLAEGFKADLIGSELATVSQTARGTNASVVKQDLETALIKNAAQILAQMVNTRVLDYVIDKKK